MSNIMGNLPIDRVEPDFPFSTIGTDFAGPFLITDSKEQGCKITKCYLCVFVCFRYKCLHLKLVSELSKDALDNGCKFVAAAMEIGKFLQSDHDSICDFAAS